MFECLVIVHFKLNIKKQANSQGGAELKHFLKVSSQKKELKTAAQIGLERRC